MLDQQLTQALAARGSLRHRAAEIGLREPADPAQVAAETVGEIRRRGVHDVAVLEEDALGDLSEHSFDDSGDARLMNDREHLRQGRLAQVATILRGTFQGSLHRNGNHTVPPVEARAPGGGEARRAGCRTAGPLIDHRPCSIPKPPGRGSSRTSRRSRRNASTAGRPPAACSPTRSSPPPTCRPATSPHSTASRSPATPPPDGRGRLPGRRHPSSPAIRPVNRSRAGMAMRIMTGSAVPEGADRVVAVEETVVAARPGAAASRSRSRRRHPPAGRDRPPRRTRCCRRARSLTPAALALLASQGIGEVESTARRASRSSLTGNEIVPPRATPGPGQLRDSHSDFLLAELAEMGLPVISLGIARDDPETLAARLRDGLEGSRCRALLRRRLDGRGRFPRAGARRIGLRDALPRRRDAARQTPAGRSPGRATGLRPAGESRPR